MAEVELRLRISRWIARRRRAFTGTAISLLVVLGLAWLTFGRMHQPPKVAAGHTLDFNQDVQPILAANCFSCHGPDPQMRKAGLRLDLEESALKKRPGHPDAIVPGHPEKSELIKRIQSTDPHHLMPQNSEGQAKPMKPEDIAVLREWIKEGAVYRPHWAFEKPVRPQLPPEARDAWVRNPIDAFVLARMKKEGLQPSPQADRPTLIRRVTLDLTGLLPTPAEVKAFVADKSPQAYEHMVDNLLSRPSFGEQRARYWLDYARYADTYGLHFDNNRFISPYRDYVIRAFNTNKPFDKFAMEQIAGDLMPATSIDPLVASGYVRLGVSSNEGGTIPEELRVNIARERTEAFGGAFMGLTVGCAVCHDHKYDPTSQKDFYALSAFFNNLDEQPFNGDRPVWAPVARIPREESRDAYDRLLGYRSQLAAKLDAMHRNGHALVQQWLQSRQNPPLPVVTDKLTLRLRLDEGGGDVVRNSAPHAQPASFPLGKSKGQWGETTWLWPDFRMETSTRVYLGNTGDRDWNQPFSAGGWFMLRAAPNYPLDQSGTLISKMDTRDHNRGWALALEKGHLSIELVNKAPRKPVVLTDNDAFKPILPMDKLEYPTPSDIPAEALKTSEERAAEAAKRSGKQRPEHKKKPAPEPKDNTPVVAIQVLTKEILPVDGNWYHVLFTYDGSGKASGVKVYIDGSPATTRVVSDKLGQSTIRNKAPMQLGWRYPDATPAQDTRYQDIHLYERTLTADEARRVPIEDYVAEIVSRPSSQWTEDQWHAVTSFYFDTIDSSARSLARQIDQVDGQLQKLSKGGELTLVAWEKPSIAYADILNRGMYTARTERVEANTPHYLPPIPAGEPHNRLALAKWVVSPDNPLTARVTVNRMWNELFGLGIVETTEDFGIMGQRPSHPELLDWLAVEFRESGWDMKHMYRLMVTSAAYRQSAKSTPAQLAKDPKNIFLSHGPRFRMDAEMLRDIALQSGGLLVNKIGGPSVKPYQPPGLWEQVGYPTSDTVHYEQGHGDALYRRSMYSYWKRMSSLPDMDAFDAPMRDAVCARRQRTDTPLQALVTMDDVQWVEAARALAERAIEKGGSQPEQRVRYISDVLLAHDPRPQTTKVLMASLSQMEHHFTADPKAARQLVDVGEKKRNPSIPAPELAAWTMIASEMLNLDETVTK